MNQPQNSEVHISELLEDVDAPDSIYINLFEGEKKYGEFIMRTLIKRWRARKPDQKRFRKIWKLQKELTSEICYLDTQLRLEEDEEKERDRKNRADGEIKQKDGEIKPTDDDICDGKML